MAGEMRALGIGQAVMDFLARQPPGATVTVRDCYGLVPGSSRSGVSNAMAKFVGDHVPSGHRLRRLAPGVFIKVGTDHPENGAPNGAASPPKVAASEVMPLLELDASSRQVRVIVPPGWSCLVMQDH